MKETGHLLKTLGIPNDLFRLDALHAYLCYSRVRFCVSVSRFAGMLSVLICVSVVCVCVCVGVTLQADAFCM